MKVYFCFNLVSILTLLSFSSISRGFLNPSLSQKQFQYSGSRGYLGLKLQYKNNQKLLNSPRNICRTNVISDSILESETFLRSNNEIRDHVSNSIYNSKDYRTESKPDDERSNSKFPFPLLDTLFKDSSQTKDEQVRKTTKRGSHNDFYVQRMNKEELNICTDICVESFFGKPTNPIRKLQLQTLFEEQQQDLKSRLFRPQNKHAMLTCVDLSNQNVNIICGFAEVGFQAGTRYIGKGIPEAEERPTIANLAIRPEYREQGLGSLLMDHCERIVQDEWGKDEIILQVEEENSIAREMYKKLGYVELFADAGARKYDISSKFGAIKSIRTTKITMRKVLSPSVKNNLLSAIFGNIGK